MRLRVVRFILVLGVAATIGLAWAQTLVQPTDPVPGAKAAPPKPPLKLVYLSAEFVSQPGLILPAPANPDSPEGRLELAAVKAAQANAMPDRIARATADDENETVWVFADVLPGFEAAKLPLTASLFKAAQNDEDFEANAFKNYFARVRPFDIDHTIKTCVPSTYGKAPRSYPSGHATLGYSLGVILAHLIPEKADAILARAKIYAESRVVCGVHFPSDTVASQVLGTAVALELMRTPAFKKDFDLAKAELAVAGLTHTVAEATRASSRPR